MIEKPLYLLCFQPLCGIFCLFAAKKAQTGFQVDGFEIDGFFSEPRKVDPDVARKAC